MYFSIFSLFVVGMSHGRRIVKKTTISVGMTHGTRIVKKTMISVGMSHGTRIVQKTIISIQFSHDSVSRNNICDDTKTSYRYYIGTKKLFGAYLLCHT